MLTHLFIKNFAVVRALEIELSAGLTVITGETGAGKSIMVDALGLVLGDRADHSIITDGADRAEVSAVFDIGANREASAWLEEHELLDEQCIIRRTLSSDGRSRAFINNSPATLQQIKALGETLLDIHSQHEHQSLLKKTMHRQMLDTYAGAGQLVENLEALYRDWSQVQKDLTQRQAQRQEQQEQQELLNYQLEELAALDLQEGELEQLEQDQSRLANAEQILQTGAQMEALCRSTEIDSGQPDCAQLIAQALRLGEALNDNNPELRNCLELLENAAIQIQEAAASLQHYLNGIELNPEKQQLVEQRLGLAHQLARKHRIRPAELVELRRQLISQQEQLGSADEQIETLQERRNTLEQQYRQQSQQLSELRAQHAAQLNQQITAQMETLGMPVSRFEIRLTPTGQERPAPHGNETVEFLVSTNPGQEPRPLQKVASGGELSRISLAIQVILARRTDTPTLIFDEVDVGIGGGTAEVVGRLLRQLGETGQVICVTHQPQVAAKSHHHLFVSKQIDADTTDSQVKLLSPDEKIAEVARMLGGVKMTSQTLAHAQEMVAQLSE